MQLLSGQAGYRLLVAAFWVALARWSPQTTVGVFAVANSVAVPIFVGLDAGLNQYLVREYREGVGLPSYLRRVLVWRTGLGVIGALVATFATHLLAAGGDALLTGALVAAGYCVDFLCQAWLSPHRAALDMGPDRRMKLVQGAAALAALGLLRVFGSVTAPNVAAGVLAAYVLAAISPWRRWSAGHAWHDDCSAAGEGRRTPLRPLLLFALAGLLPAIYTRLDDIAVALAGGASVVAGYTLAYKLIESARLPSWALSRVVLARASRRREAGDSRQEARHAMQLSRAIALGAALVCSLAGPRFALILFGSAYAGVGDIVRILSVSVLIAGFTGPAQGFLLGAGHEGRAAAAAGWTLAAMAIGLAVLTPPFGGRGAAWCVVVAEGVNGVLLLRALTADGFRVGSLPANSAFALGLLALGAEAVDPRLTLVAFLGGGVAIILALLASRRPRPPISMGRDRGLAFLVSTERPGGIERYCADLLRVSANAVEWQEVRFGRRGTIGPAGRLLEMGGAVRTARAFRPNVVFADRLHVLPFAIVVKLLGGRPRPTVTLGLYGTELVTRSLRRAKRVAVRFVDRGVACSHWSSDATRAYLRFSGPVAVVHPGVEVDLWERPARFCRTTARAQWGIEPEDFLLVTVCRIDRNARHKGVDRVLDAVAALRAEGIRVSYLLVGGGSDEAWVDDRVAALRLTTAVVRIGRVPDDMLRDALWASDAFALPSVAETDAQGAVQAVEGFGIVLLEANSAGLPVIATGAGGTAEAMQPGLSGLLVDGSSASIADAVRRLAGDNGCITAGGPRQWAQRFEWAPRRLAVTHALVGDSRVGADRSLP